METKLATGEAAEAAGFDVELKMYPLIRLPLHNSGKYQLLKK